jgi:hypothetical protein
MIPENCASCQGWNPRGETALGCCDRLATPCEPIDGQPAWARPFKWGNDGCRHYLPHSDTAEALRRQAMVRAQLEGQAA